MIEFKQPLVLLLLLVIPPIVLWYLKFGRNQEGTLRFSSSKLIPDKAIQSGENKIRLLIGIKIVIIMLALTALAGPQLSDTMRETNTDVVDIMLVIDQSSSMLAQDFNPDRLGAAKEVAKSFIKTRRQDRLGIIVFAAQSFIQCPLTTDTDVLVSFTDKIEIVSKEYDGTAIGMAIANAVNRLRFSESKSKTIILLSDGSNNRGELDPLTAADLAAKFDIKIYTIGAGTKGLAPYPIQDAWGRTRIQKVEVEVDEETLREIAQLTDGKFYRATDNESLMKIYSEIDRLERTKIEVIEYQNVTELYSWFTIPATLLALGLIVTSKGIFGKIF